MGPTDGPPEEPTFKPRPRTLDIPRPPAGVLGRGLAANRLAQRLVTGSTTISGLRTVMSDSTEDEDFLVVLDGSEPRLWCPGCEYLAKATDHPELWLPTTLGFDVADELVARALLRELGRGLFPIALLPGTAESFDVISLHGARPVDRQHLVRRFDLSPKVSPDVSPDRSSETQEDSNTGVPLPLSRLRERGPGGEGRLRERGPGGEGSGHEKGQETES